MHTNKVKAWIIAGRFFSAPWMIVNCLLGITLAGFDCIKWLESVAIVLSVLLAGHFINAWRDFQKGIDKINGSKIKPYTAGSQVLPQGWLSLRTVKLSAIGLLIVSGLLLCTFAPFRLDIILLYLLGVFCALTYTDWFKPRGLGEISLFLGHGFGATAFAYSLVTPLDLTGLSAGVLLGFFAGVVYTIDQLQDVETDFAKKVKTLAYKFFKANMRVSQLWYFVVIGTLVMQLGMAVIGWLPYETLITVALLPLAYVAGIYLDYHFEKGILLALCTLWLYPTLIAVGVLFL